MRRGRGVDKTRSKRTCCCRKCARWWIERRVESQPYPGALESEAIQDQVQGVHQNPSAAVLVKGSRWQWLRLHSQYLSNLLFLLQLHQAGSWFSNQKKDIVRVGMYKRTKLHHQAWQMACLNNLYDNFCRSEGINDHPCDLMRHCRDRVPSWTADLLQVQNSGPFYHDQQIYLLQMFHISMCRCTATSLFSPSNVNLPEKDRRSSWEESSPLCSAIIWWRPGGNMGGFSLVVDLDWLFSYRWIFAHFPPAKESHT